MIKKKTRGELLVEPTDKIVDKGEYYILCSKVVEIVNLYKATPKCASSRETYFSDLLSTLSPNITSFA